MGRREPLVRNSEAYTNSSNSEQQTKSSEQEKKDSEFQQFHSKLWDQI
jgi:hypothetical protein